MWLLLMVGIVSTVASGSKHHSSSTATNVVQENRSNLKNHKPSNVVEYDLNINPITHLEMIKQTIELDKRVRRNPQRSSFDRGYDEFLRNYRKDGPSDTGGNYKVKERSAEEQQSESNENDDDEDNSNDDDDDASDEKSSSSKKKKSYKKHDDDYDRIKHESDKTRKGKHCKSEYRGNQLCNICYNPKNDQKSESCKQSSGPVKDKNYAYSNEKKYSHKESDDDRESFEETHEFTTKRPQLYNPPRPYPNRYPVRSPSGTPIYRRIPRPNSYSIIRYRTNVPIPRQAQRIRIITIPGPPPPHATPLPAAHYIKQSQLNQRPFPFTAPENRPQRESDYNRRPYSEQLKSPANESKKLSDDIELLPKNYDKKDDGEFAEFVADDWSDCKQYTEGELLCFECDQNGARNKECMFASKKKPGETRQAYAKSNAYDYEKSSSEGEEQEEEEEPLKKSSSNRRQAKIHPAWRTSPSTSQHEKKSQNETKRAFDRNSKATKNNSELKVQHRSA